MGNCTAHRSYPGCPIIRGKYSTGQAYHPKTCLCFVLHVSFTIFCYLCIFVEKNKLKLYARCPYRVFGVARFKFYSKKVGEALFDSLSLIIAVNGK